MPDDRESPKDQAPVLTILRNIDEINNLNDVDSILDKILFDSREFANADAGSIFLVEDDHLTFSYVQNDTLFDEQTSQAALYQNFTLPISEQSIVGYVAKTKKSLNIEDAYNISPSLPYVFNKGFDKKSGYRTTSLLTIPLLAQESRLVGVMQLINARDDTGKLAPFTKDDTIYVPLFCNNAAVAIERGIMNRELILRMMRMAELRDPMETGAHVQRVGAFCAEMYGAWAARRGHRPKEIKQQRDNIRLAAMLHDVGKVGIPDAILKKPARLTSEEYTTMQQHTLLGARLFNNERSNLDAMSKDIILGHHERWDGTGYPGRPVDPAMPDSKPKPIMGEEIPLSARICAVADVFDALASARSYKEAYPEEKCLRILKEKAGSHFDPEIVDIFFEIFDVIKAIQHRFQDV